MKIKLFIALAAVALAPVLLVAEIAAQSKAQINRSLPLNESTVVSFIPKRWGTFNFTCGMNMMRGRLIVR